MKKVFLVLSLTLFVGNIATASIVESNTAQTEVTKKEKKKKKKKKKKGSCKKSSKGSCCSHKN